MRRVRAYDRKTGLFAEMQQANTKDEATRYSHDYRCLNEACDCTLHWRRAVEAKENTDPRAATFVKNKSSAHIDGCRYDYVEFAREHRDVAFSDGDDLNLRLLFPMGSAPSDRFAWKRGMLTEEQKRAAHDNINKQGFSSLRKLVDFLEENFEGLEDPALDDLFLHYQGEKYAWSDLWVASDHYSKLIERAQEINDRGETSPVFTAVHPTHEIVPNDKGKRRFVCEPQYAQPENKILSVKPILVCSDEFTAHGVHSVVKKEGHILISSRPFISNFYPGSDVPVYLNCHEHRQLSQINPNYWRLVSGPRHQMGLFNRNEAPIHHAPSRKLL